MDALEEFKNASGLVPSIPKSTAFFSNVPDYVKNAILSVMPFAKGVLPVKYLGVLLVSSRLAYNDCKVLVEKVQNRIGDWKNKFLSFAGRLQLVKSVLSSMHIYWASVFILPVRIINEIEQLLRGFLWCQGEMQRGKAKVAWDTICLPMKVGGLGVRNLQGFNKAIMAYHIWNIFCNKESLWVQWIHSYKLNGRSFWDVAPRAGISWGWCKLLQIREEICPNFWYVIGNGRKASVWFDIWHSLCPLNKRMSVRDMNTGSVSLDNCVYELVTNRNWNWPTGWNLKYPELNSFPVPIMQPNVDDRLYWRQTNGNLVDFSVSEVWESIRDRRQEVVWHNMVWFSHCIPRHAFIVWLIMLRSLKTQD